MDVDSDFFHGIEEPSPKLKTQKSKKRKRDKHLQEQEKAGEPDNLHEETEETIKARVQFFPDNGAKILPIVGYFPSGYSPCKSSPENRDREEPGVGNSAPKVKVFQHKTRSRRMRLVVSPSGSPVEFVGGSDIGEGTASQVCRYSLGVFDKETKTLKIVPIAYNKIIRLGPVVRGSGAGSDEPSSSVKTELSASDKIGKRRELTSLYGTKSSIRQDKKMLTLNKEEDPQSQKVLENKIKEIEVDKEALASTSALITRNIPPYDSSAITPQEAYPLDQIIFKGEWEYLEDIYKLLQTGKKLTGNAYSNFVRNRYYKLQGIQDEEEKKTLSCIFSYISHLVKFNDQFSMDRYSSAKNYRFPRILKQKFMSTFADEGSKKLSIDKRNLLTGYILVLTLHADGFQTDPSDIAKDLGMSTRELARHFENLGCKISRKNNLESITLPVPLEFPKEVRRRRR